MPYKRITLNKGEKRIVGGKPLLLTGISKRSSGRGRYGTFYDGDRTFNVSYRHKGYCGDTEFYVPDIRPQSVALAVKV